jgi:hypothetical protein
MTRLEEHRPNRKCPGITVESHTYWDVPRPAVIYNAAGMGLSRRAIGAAGPLLLRRMGHAKSLLPTSCRLTLIRRRA